MICCFFVDRTTEYSHILMIVVHDYFINTLCAVTSDSHIERTSILNVQESLSIRFTERQIACTGASAPLLSAPLHAHGFDYNVSIRTLVVCAPKKRKTLSVYFRRIFSLNTSQI